MRAQGAAPRYRQSNRDGSRFTAGSGDAASLAERQFQQQCRGCQIPLERAVPGKRGYCQQCWNGAALRYALVRYREARP